MAEWLGTQKVSPRGWVVLLVGNEAMRGRRLDPKRVGAITEGAIWDRRRGDKRRGEHETSVEILRTVSSRIGRRILVRGLKTGRQWVVNPETLLYSYDPRSTKIKSSKVTAREPRRRPPKA
jgi:hypothetical protein